MRVQLKSHLEVDLCAISHFLDEWGKERQKTNVAQKVTCYFLAEDASMTCNCNQPARHVCLFSYGGVLVRKVTIF